MAKGNKNKKKQNGSGPKADVAVNGSEKAEVEEETLEAPIEAGTVQTPAEEETPVDNTDKVKKLEEQVKQLTLKLESQEPKEVPEGDKDTVIRDLQEKLKQRTEESEKHETDYNNLLGRLSSMKSVFSKMKEAQSELEESQEKVSQLDSINSELTVRLDTANRENKKLKEQLGELREETSTLNSECERWSKDLSELRAEYQAKDDEWTQEKQQLVSSRNKLLIENEELNSQHEDLLIMLNEEKMLKQNMVQEISDLKATISQLEASMGSVEDSKAVVLDQLSQVRTQLKETVESYEAEITRLKEEISQLQAEVSQNSEGNAALLKRIAELEDLTAKIPTLEGDVKEKQLQIGKLRHDNVVLNEHLTKALRLIKKDSNTEQVDRELVSNLFISFLSIPRTDTKKFEVLQLISNFLNWDDDKKIQAGLKANPNAKTAGKHSRVSSASNILAPSPEDVRSESFVSLWTEFLEKETSQ